MTETEIVEALEEGAREMIRLAKELSAMRGHEGGQYAVRKDASVVLVTVGIREDADEVANFALWLHRRAAERGGACTLRSLVL